MLYGVVVMLLVDSTVWIDYFNGVENPQTNYLHAAIERTPIIVGDLILAEVLQGFRQDVDFEKARRALSKFLQASLVGPDLAIQSARNYRTLRQKGATVRKTIDALIATWCIENDHELLHNDSDFDSYEKYLGLKVVHP
jgi:predicted nucleic acid-binding protein